MIKRSKSRMGAFFVTLAALITFITVSSGGDLYAHSKYWRTPTSSSYYWWSKYNQTTPTNTTTTTAPVTTTTVAPVTTTTVAPVTTTTAPVAVTTASVPSGSTSVKNYGAKGDGVTDDTSAINSTINYVASIGGGTVYVPAGTYMVNVDSPIRLKSNVALNLASGATLKAKPTSTGDNTVIDIVNASNVKVSGGKILGERYSHLGSYGEWGMGIRIQGANTVNISDMDISNCWGDGIIIDSGSQGYSSNITIENITMNSNRRQGISIISAKNLTVRNSTISNTSGTQPQSGLDFEPDSSSQLLQNIVIENVHTEYNKGYGIECWLGAGTSNNVAVPKSNVSVTIINHTDTGSAGGTLHNISWYKSAGYNFTIK